MDFIFWRRSSLGIFLLTTSPLWAYKVTEDQSQESIEKNLSPSYKLTVSGVVNETPKEDKAEPGEKTYKTYCSACHGYGIAGAPKTGDKEAWKKRMDQGWDTIMNHAINGYKGMPAKGNCLSCSNDEVRRSIDYILKNSDLENVY